MTDPWWAGLPPASTTIECGEDEHRIEWARGELHLIDHPDVEGDRTLAALGGEAFPCLAVLDAWQRHRDDLRILLYATRGPSDPVRPSALDPMPGRRGRGGPRAQRVSASAAWFATAPNAGVITSAGSRRVYTMSPASAASRSSGRGRGPDEDDMAGIAGLLSLGGGLTDRLAATVLAEWVERIDEDDARARDRDAELHAALFGRVAAAAGRWLGDPSVEVEVVMSRDERTIARSDDGYVVTLPFRWLLDVWARDLAVVVGRFCLAAAGPPEQRELRLVDSDLGERTATIALA